MAKRAEELALDQRIQQLGVLQSRRRVAPEALERPPVDRALRAELGSHGLGCRGDLPAQGLPTKPLNNLRVDPIGFIDGRRNESGIKITDLPCRTPGRHQQISQFVGAMPLDHGHVADPGSEMKRGLV